MAFRFLKPWLVETILDQSSIDKPRFVQIDDQISAEQAKSMDLHGADCEDESVILFLVHDTKHCIVAQFCTTGFQASQSSQSQSTDEVVNWARGTILNLQKYKFELLKTRHSNPEFMLIVDRFSQMFSNDQLQISTTAYTCMRDQRVCTLARKLLEQRTPIDDTQSNEAAADISDLLGCFTQTQHMQAETSSVCIDSKFIDKKFMVEAKNNKGSRNRQTASSIEKEMNDIELHLSDVQESIDLSTDESVWNADEKTNENVAENKTNTCSETQCNVKSQFPSGNSDIYVKNNSVQSECVLYSTNDKQIGNIRKNAVKQYLEKTKNLDLDSSDTDSEFGAIFSKKHSLRSSSLDTMQSTNTISRKGKGIGKSSAKIASKDKRIMIGNELDVNVTKNASEQLSVNQKEKAVGRDNLKEKSSKDGSRTDKGQIILNVYNDDDLRIDLCRICSDDSETSDESETEPDPFVLRVFTQVMNDLAEAGHNISLASLLSGKKCSNSAITRCEEQVVLDNITEWQEDYQPTMSSCESVDLLKSQKEGTQQASCGSAGNEHQMDQNDAVQHRNVTTISSTDKILAEITIPGDQAFPSNKARISDLNQSSTAPNPQKDHSSKNYSDHKKNKHKTYDTDELLAAMTLPSCQTKSRKIIDDFMQSVEGPAIQEHVSLEVGTDCQGSSSKSYDTDELLAAMALPSSEDSAPPKTRNQPVAVHMETQTRNPDVSNPDLQMYVSQGCDEDVSSKLHSKISVFPKTQQSMLSEGRRKWLPNHTQYQSTQQSQSAQEGIQLDLQISPINNKCSQQKEVDSQFVTECCLEKSDEENNQNLMKSSTNSSDYQEEERLAKLAKLKNRLSDYEEEKRLKELANPKKRQLDSTDLIITVADSPHKLDGDCDEFETGRSKKLKLDCIAANTSKLEKLFTEADIPCGKSVAGPCTSQEVSKLNVNQHSESLFSSEEEKSKSPDSVEIIHEDWPDSEKTNEIINICDSSTPDEFSQSSKQEELSNKMEERDCYVVSSSSEDTKFSGVGKCSIEENKMSPTPDSVAEEGNSRKLVDRGKFQSPIQTQDWIADHEIEIIQDVEDILNDQLSANQLILRNAPIPDQLLENVKSYWKKT